MRAKGVESPRLCAELMLAHVLGCPRLKLYMEADRPASPLERDLLRTLVARALKHEPVQYLVGEAWFFGLPFKVDRRVLIPRPSTEALVEEVVQHARTRGDARGATGRNLLIADVCTGSGCVAVALAKGLPGARVVATDLSVEALELARENAARHGVIDRIDLLHGDLLAPLRDHPVTRGDASLDYLVANPPYIPDHEWVRVPPNVKDHEPSGALRGGRDGLDLVRPLIQGGPSLVKPGGLMLIEVAASHAEAALQLASSHPLGLHARIIPDVEGLPRVIRVERVG